MDDNYISEEEYQQRLDEVRERDPNLYEYIMWGNSPDEPFDYDAMEVRLLLAVKEQEEGQKQSVGDFSKMTATGVVERILTQYGMGQEVYVSGKEIADTMRYNPTNIPMYGAGMYERKEIAPGKYINVRIPQPFTPAWYTNEGKAFGDNPVVTNEPSNGIDGHLLVEDEASTWEIPGKYEDDKEVESAIDWEMLETLRDEDELQQQMEQNRRDIAAIFGITLKELGVGSSNVSALQAVAEIQRHEITIELLVGHKEMEKYRYELRERAASCAAHCFHANGYAEYYDMVYRLCAEGYSLEQAIYGYKK